MFVFDSTDTSSKAYSDSIPCYLFLGYVINTPRRRHAVYPGQFSNLLQGVY